MYLFTPGREGFIAVLTPGHIKLIYNGRAR